MSKFELCKAFSIESFTNCFLMISFISEAAQQTRLERHSSAGCEDGDGSDIRTAVQSTNGAGGLGVCR